MAGAQRVALRYNDAEENRQFLQIALGDDLAHSPDQARSRGPEMAAWPLGIAAEVSRCSQLGSGFWAHSCCWRWLVPSRRGMARLSSQR
jgi:hypothetical protein